jgi:hypothetical protein
LDAPTDFLIAARVVARQLLFLAEELVLQERLNVSSPNTFDPVLIERGRNRGTNDGRPGHEVAVADLELLAREVGSELLIESIHPVGELKHRRLVGLKPSPEKSV